MDTPQARSTALATEEVNYEYLEERCRAARRLLIRELGNVNGATHVGGSLSIIDALVTVYYGHMRVDTTNPKLPGRDRFILSKGHAGPGLYAVLCEFGYFGEEVLWTLNQGGTNLPSHPDMNKVPGVDMTTGSLGQGFSAAIGVAKGALLDSDGARVYTLVGDGESQEGQIWEAALLGAQLALDNLVAFTDYNGLNIDGPLDVSTDLAPLAEKWTAFGWHTMSVDGHDVRAIDAAIREAHATKGKPSMIILRTVKGRGVSFIEAMGTKNHSFDLSAEQVERALAELGGGR